jgi:hypothetical protein
VCDRSAEDAHSSAAPDPTFLFVGGTCCLTLDFLSDFWITITFSTPLTSLFCIYSIHGIFMFFRSNDPPKAYSMLLEQAAFKSESKYEGHSKNTWTMSLPFKLFFRNSKLIHYILYKHLFYECVNFHCNWSNESNINQFQN